MKTPTKTMKLVIDENIAYIRETFAGYGEIVLSHGRKITNELLKDADVLIVRSITNVNAELLQNTNVKFVGTATIGTDHIDKEYLKQNNIAFADAKGCNADAVTEYVYTAISKFLVESGTPSEGVKLGVIGRGNIGGRVVKLAPYLGLKLLVNDPPLQRQGVKYPFVDLQTALSADILTIHTPLYKSGIDKTLHLINSDNIGRTQNIRFLINASRGETAETFALTELTKERKIPLCLDVWENEPKINSELLGLSRFASPHIAGYTLEGKINGTMMMKKALDKFINYSDTFTLLPPLVEDSRIQLQSNKPIIEILYEASRFVYKIEKDTEILKQAAGMPAEESGKYFDSLRRNYELRREFTNYTIELLPYNAQAARVLRMFRFNVV